MIKKTSILNLSKSTNTTSNTERALLYMINLRMKTILQGMALGMWSVLGYAPYMYILRRCRDGFGLSGEGCGHGDDGGPLG